MLKKKYVILMIMLICGSAAFSGGCGEQPADNVKQENEEKVSEDISEEGTEALQSSGLIFTTQDIYGETVTEDIFKDYDLTLVNLFATWCSPCVSEMPELAKLDQNMEEKNVNVVAVCLDSLNNRGELDLQALSLAQQIAELSGVEFSFLVPDETYFQGRLMGVQAVPESFFVDRNGNIVGETYVGARDLAAWTEIVEQELSNLERDTQ